MGCRVATVKASVYNSFTGNIESIEGRHIMPISKGMEAYEVTLNGKRILKCISSSKDDFEVGRKLVAIALQSKASR